MHYTCQTIEVYFQQHTFCSYVAFAHPCLDLLCYQGTVLTSVRPHTVLTVFTDSCIQLHSEVLDFIQRHNVILQPEKPHPSFRPLILCLEDDKSYLYLRKAVLEKAGYDVIGVSTASDALDALREAPVCLVLADHMLRDTTGVEVAAKMKKIRPDVPVILYSGKNPDSMKNVDLFINKDVPTSKFLAILRDVLSRYCS